MKDLIKFSVIMGVVLSGFSRCAPPTETEEPSQYIITFDSQGADTPAVPATVTLTLPDNTVANLPADPVKTGYTFTGWRTAPYNQGSVFSTNTAVSGNITLYATWTSDALAAISKRELVNVTGVSDDSFIQQSDLNENGDAADANESFIHNVSSYKIGKYEVTYELWYLVYQWAVRPENAYVFSSPGAQGSEGTNGAAPTLNKWEPVTSINWRDVIVWCNAYSQIAGLRPAYYTEDSMRVVLKVSTDNNTIDTAAGSQDNPYVDWSAAGYRLPTEGEWHYAAAYQDGSSWTPFNYAAGAGTYHNDVSDSNPANGIPDGKDANDGVAVYQSHWDGSKWTNTSSVTQTAEVGTKLSNQLQLFDMSGNVFEWCWDRKADYPVTTQTDYRGMGSDPGRIVRGGSFMARKNELPGYLYGFISDNLQIGNRGYGLPYGGSTQLGLRVVQSQ